MINNMQTCCQVEAKKVQDKTSYALIKNILLVLSAILTIGVSLGIYAAVTKQSRAETGHFFFTNMELNKKVIDEVNQSVSEVKLNLSP